MKAVSIKFKSLISVSVLACGWAATVSVFSDEFSDAEQLFRSGQYEQCIEACSAGIADSAFRQEWPILKIRVEMTTGQYQQAFDTLNSALDVHPNSIRIRLAGIDVCKYNDEIERAFELEQEIDRLYSRSAWRYRDGINQIAIGRFLLSRRADAKRILDDFFSKVKNNQPDLVEPYLAIGELALSKNDFGLAAQNFRRALELDDADPDTHFFLAQSLERSDFKAANELINRALELNPNHIPSLLSRAENQIDGEIYDIAQATLQTILEVNPHEPSAWAFRSVIAHLSNDSQQESDCRDKALGHWKFNPEVDYLIGKKLSAKYRFKEGEAYQRRALVFDDQFLPAQIQLAQDTMRLGKEQEGWGLAAKVYNADSYNVIAHNLVALRSELEKYETIERENFVIRMDPLEAKIYGRRVAELLSEASDVLETKYKIEIRTPIIVEIFSRQQDFAIRTFGTPGGDGFLGVCFGNVVTMNSPAAQGSNLTSWASVLWHEFCHVVTLQKTGNKMPRWLSEGISVYEERLANSAWGQSMNLQYQKMILGGELTPVSQLSNAFLKPKSAAHLQFAYFESSLVVQYLVDQHGIETLIRVLDDLQIGIPINESLSRYVGSIKLFEKEFEDYAQQLANDLSAKGDWSEPEIAADADVDSILEFVRDNPQNISALLLRAISLIESEQWDEAEKVCRQLIEFNYNLPGERHPQLLLAKIYRATANSQKEIQALENYLLVDLDSLDPILRLMDLYHSQQDWESTIKTADRYVAVNPLIPVPHRYLAESAMKTKDYDLAISSLNAQVALDPIDPAEVYFQLAKAYFAKDEVSSAKRSVLKSIEEAPRYRAAHLLLLKIVDREKQRPEEPARLEREQK